MPLHDIDAALTQRYLDGDYGLTTAYPGVEFKPPKTPWARFKNLGSNIDALTGNQNGLNEHTGVLQIDIAYPFGDGSKSLNEKAGEIAQGFKVGTDLTRNGVVIEVDRQTIGESFKDGSYLKVILSIFWNAHVQR